MTGPRLGILCVGQFVADIVVRPVDRLPVPGRLDLLEDLMLVPGGCACNTASVLAKLGAAVRTAGLVGMDPLGKAIMAEIEAAGVDVSMVSRTREVPTTAVVVVVSSDGQRSFLYRQGTTEAFDNSMVPAKAYQCCGLIHVGGSMKLRNLDLRAFLAPARAAGCQSSLDTDWDPTGDWLNVIGPALPLVDHLITNEEEGEALSGCKGPDRIARALLEFGPSNVVVKLGPDGSYWANGQSSLHVPAFPVDVVDTTCAGDAFVAGYLLGVSSGLNPSDRLVLGNAAGSLATTALSHFGVRSLGAALELIRAHAGICPQFAKFEFS
jgi:sugar/nucleoside kinase (ribokinase family)